MEDAHRLFHPCFLNNAGYPYLRGGNQLDIYLCLAESAEHTGGITGGVLHTGTDDTDFSQGRISSTFPGADRVSDGVSDFHSLLQLATGDCKSEVGHIGDTGILDDGINADTGPGEGNKDGGGNTGAVRHADDGYLGYVKVMSHAAHLVSNFHGYASVN